MRRSLDDICHERSFLSISETTSPRPVAQEPAPINDVRKSVEIAPPNGNINNNENDDTVQRKSSRLTKLSLLFVMGTRFPIKVGEIS